MMAEIADTITSTNDFEAILSDLMRGDHVVLVFAPLAGWSVCLILNRFFG